MLAKQGPHGRRRLALADVVEGVDEGGVALPKDLCQLIGALQARAPGRRLECKLDRRAIPAHRRQLKEITDEHKLQPAKRLRAAAHAPRDEIEKVEEVAVEHRHLIDDKRRGSTPLRAAFACRHGDQLGDGAVGCGVPTNPGKMVYRSPADGARSD